MKLDKSKPFGQIFGFTEDGSRYVQDGVFFTASGDPVEKAEDDDEILIEPTSDPEEVIASLDEPEDLSKVHWKTLEKRVIAAGGEYTTKEDAIAFLENL